MLLGITRVGGVLRRRGPEPMLSAVDAERLHVAMALLAKVADRSDAAVAPAERSRTGSGAERPTGLSPGWPPQRSARA